MGRGHGRQRGQRQGGNGEVGLSDTQVGMVACRQQGCCAGTQAPARAACSPPMGLSRSGEMVLAGGMQEICGVS